MADSRLVFNAELLAPCGMNCALCSAYLAGAVARSPDTPRVTTCAGCRARNKKCAFIKRDCVQLRLGKLSSCSECSDMPCERLKKLDEGYRSRYSYSMIETLRKVQANGVEAVLAAQRESHKCHRCGGVICIHNGKCYACDKPKSWRG